MRDTREGVMTRKIGSVPEGFITSMKTGPEPAVSALSLIHRMRRKQLGKDWQSL